MGFRERNGLGIRQGFNVGLGGGFVGLLDEVPNAAFASSVRLLRADYSGGLARIIAYNGVTQFGAADIMPYRIGDEYWLDLNSTLENLDATAIARGLTTSDTLADLCSVGVNDYDGLTTSWYGQQAGAINNATQANIANMPKVVNSGALITENGKPAIESARALNWLDLDSSFTANTLLSVSKINVYNTLNYIAFNSATNEGLFTGGTFSGVDGTGLVFSGSAYSANNESLNQRIDYWNHNATRYEVAKNDDLFTDLTATTPIDINRILGRNNPGDLSFRGKTHEIVGYNTSKSGVEVLFYRI